MATVLRICQNCGNTFQADTRNTERGWGLYCSKSCAAKMREKIKADQDKPRPSFEELLAKANAENGRKRPDHPEEDLQKQCCQWYDLQWGNRKFNGVEIKKLLHHSPNGGKRSAREAARFKSMGTRAGFPDFWLGIPSNGCPYLCIELKTLRKDSDQSPGQREYEQLVKAMGARYIVVRTLQEFINAVNSYLEPLGIKA